jgi:hypothetical protein
MQNSSLPPLEIRNGGDLFTYGYFTFTFFPWGDDF